MVIQILAADPVAVGVRIVPPAENAGVGDVVWKEIAEPVDGFRRRPRLVSMAVQAVNGDDADNVSKKRGR